MTLHDANYRTEIQKRFRNLRPDAQRQWGKMSVTQMLWHVNQGMEVALGRIVLPPDKAPLPRALLKFIVIKLPWPKSPPTLQGLLPEGDSYDFEAERSRCLRLIDQIAATSLDSTWAPSARLGPMTGPEVTRLQAKHLNHHLTQFGA